MIKSLCKRIIPNSEINYGLKARKSAKTLHFLGAYLVEKSLKVNFSLGELERPPLNSIKLIGTLRSDSQIWLHLRVSFSHGLQSWKTLSGCALVSRRFRF